MSIDDDYYDVAKFVEGSEYEDAFDRINTYMNQLEAEIVQLKNEKNELTTTVRVMMGIQEKSPYANRPSPYDLSRRDTGRGR